MNDRTQTELEERLAFLERALEDLSDITARQDAEISRLTARVDMLLTREAERESDALGTVPLADQKPPHW